MNSAGLCNALGSSQRSAFEDCPKRRDLSAIFPPIILGFVAAFILVVLTGCTERPMRRPVTVLNLGDYRQYDQPFTFRKDLGLVVFKDQNGLSFMSTACTYDLAYLTFVPSGGNSEALGSPEQSGIFISSFSTSRYSLTGEVLQGPSKFPLPFYKARLAEAQLGGPATNIYVELPGEVSRDWRLVVPTISSDVSSEIISP